MNRSASLRYFALFVALIASAVGQAARAEMVYRYTFQFDALDIGQFHYDAATFSYDSEGLLGEGQATNLNPIGTLNGFRPDALFFFDGDSFFGPSGNFDGPDGTINSFAFYTQDVVTGVGTYESRILEGYGQGAGRFLLGVPTSDFNNYVHGVLTVTQVDPAAVPEPGSVTLLASAGLLGLARLALRRPRRWPRSGGAC